MEQHLLKQKSQAVNELAPMRARLEGAVLNLVNASTGISVVIAHEGAINQDLFQALGQQAIENNPSIHNIGIAPDDVITQIYPLKENHRAIGLEYAKNSEQYMDVRLARITKKPLFSGPHQLVQGGLGLIVRVPVFRQMNDAAHSTKYWGVVSIVTDVERLLTKAHVANTETFTIGLKKNTAATSEEGTVILLGNTELFAQANPVCMPVEVPGTQWQLCAVPHLGWPALDPSQSLRLYVGSSLSLMLALAIGWLVERPRRIQSHNQALKNEIRERAITEENLRFSEQKYASIFQLIPDMAGITQLEDGSFLEINAGFTAVSGWTAQEVIGHSSIDLGLWTIEERQAAIAILRQKGVLENFPFMLRLKSGVLHYALMYLIPIEVSKEKCLYFMAQDVHVHKCTQIALEQERTNLRNLLQTVPALIWLKNAEGKYLSCNSRFERFVGQKEGNIIGQDDYQLFSQEVALAFHTFDQQAVENNAPSINEEWVTYADDGHQELLETIKTPVRDDSGNLIGVLGIAWDITEKKRTEKELLKERTRFINLVDSIDGIVWETDADSLRFTYVSREAQRLLGYPMHQWSADDFWRHHLHPEDREWAYEATRKATAHGEDHELTYRFQAADGRTVWIQDRITVAMENGNPRWRRGIMVDTTQEKESEQQRLALENQLRQAQKIEAIGRLAGGVAHDFNNQLSVILGYADLMNQSHVAEEKRHAYVNQIIRAANHSRDITRQLLAFSRQEEISPQVLDLNLLVKGIKKGLGRLIREDISVEVRTSPDLWPVYMDSTQVDQILMNLIVNARDAIEGHGQITVTTENVTLEASYTSRYPDFNPGDYVQISIRDSGMGMQPDTLLHIFEPFYTTKESGKGTGLGLATVYGIVNQNRGQVVVESEIGVGTTFQVFLPRTLAPITEAYERPTETILPQYTGTILLVEDEETVRQMTQDMLAASGYTVLVASTPSEALTICSQPETKIDLLLSDMIMPEMNGRELCSKTRALRPNLKTVFMSGYAGDVLKEDNDCQIPLIKKPFTIHSLLKTITEQLLG